MFTGIVEQVGKVISADSGETGARLTLGGDGLGELPLGASIAVSGVCLTVVESSHGRIAVDVIPETLRLTNLGRLGEGDHVNLERPMRADGRFDGHIVQGHVDGVGVVKAIDRGDGEVRMTIEAPGEMMAHVIEKGSITVDGVSLTIAALAEADFTVALIPHTLEATTLGLRDVGDVVNLETDVLARYVERLLRNE